MGAKAFTQPWEPRRLNVPDGAVTLSNTNEIVLLPLPAVTLDPALSPTRRKAPAHFHFLYMSILFNIVLYVSICFYIFYGFTMSFQEIL